MRALKQWGIPAAIGIAGLCAIHIARRYTTGDWMLVYATYLTLLILGYQAIQMRKATEAMREATELQKVMATQWVDLEKWTALAPPWDLIQENVRVQIGFDIVNRTSMPLTLRFVEVFTTAFRETFSTEDILVPKGRRAVDFGVVVREKGRIDLLFSGQLIFYVLGTITFKDAFGEWQKQRFGEICKGGVGGFEFSPFHGWLSSDDYENQHPEEF